MIATTPHIEAGTQYAHDILAGKIPACKWVKLACQRHFNDLERAASGEWPYEFLPDTAEKKCTFLELFPHTKGKWAKQRLPFVLAPWQCFATMSIFGWVRKDTGKRRFRRAYLAVPRKNGKSPWAARIGLLMFANDGEAGAEVYSGATTEKQAMEVQRPAYRMAKAVPDFQEFYGVTVPKAEKSPLFIEESGAKFAAVIGKPGDGGAPSCAIIDEYHEHQTNDLFDTMETGMGSREQPLTLIITTAGDNLGGPCHALQLDLHKILEGTVQDETFWGTVYSIDVDDDPFTEAAIRKANPNYDVSIDGAFLKMRLAEAIRNSSRQGIYQTKHLNVWVGSRNAFFNVKSWGLCPKILAQDCRGYRLYLGMDLASAKDIASLSGVFVLDDGRYATFGKHYIPESSVLGAENTHFAGWATDGHLVATDGNMIDHDRIEEDVKALHSEFGIAQLGFDPAQAPMMMTHLQAYGIECIEVRPTVMNFSEPMKILDALILAGKLEHEHNPAMLWMMSNVVAKTDNKDNVYPNKEKPESKIDGPVALIIAMSRALDGIEESVSVYDSEDWEEVMA